MNRSALFCGCISVRLLIAFFLYAIIRTPWFSIPFFAIGIGFVISWFRGKKKGFFGGPAYWADFRPIHALLWTITGGFTAGSEFVIASLFIFIDTAIGIAVFWTRHIPKVEYTPISDLDIDTPAKMPDRFAPLHF